MNRSGPPHHPAQCRLGRWNRALCLGIVLAFAATSANAQDIEIEPTGRLHLDYATHDVDVRPLTDDFLVRRARLGIDGKIGDDLSFEITYDFADGGSFKNVSVAYEGLNQGDITVGQFKVPFGLEELTSSNNITFIERSLPSSAFAQGRRLGIGFNSNGDNHSFAVMGFGYSIDGDEGRGAGARFTFTPINDDETLFHLGVAVTTENPANDEVQFDPRPESRPTDVRFVDTGDLEGVSRINQLGLEAAWRRGPLSVQMEWMRALINRNTGRPDVDFGGWYVAGSWIATGESREYRNGTFRGISSERPAGAWELTARYSRINLDDEMVRGGNEDNITLGLNWYANEYLRIMANFIKVRSERGGVSDDPNVFLVRTQIAF